MPAQSHNDSVVVDIIDVNAIVDILQFLVLIQLFSRKWLQKVKVLKPHPSLRQNEHEMIIHKHHTTLVSY